MGKIRYPFALTMAILLLMFSSAKKSFQEQVYSQHQELVATSPEQECMDISSYLPFELVKLTLLFTLAVFASGLLVLASGNRNISLNHTRAPGHICPQLSLIPSSNAP